MIEKVLIIANPGSGKGEAPKYAKQLEAILLDTYKSEVAIRETGEVGDAEKWAKAAKDEQFDTVICLGGDGTVNEIVNGLMQVDNPPQFSFVPMGTANDLGRVLGFEMDPDSAVEQFRALEVDKVDVGQVNDLYFIDVVAIGDLSSAVMETDSDMKNKFGFFAYIMDGAKAVVEGKGNLFEVKNSDGEIFTFNSNLVLMALTSSIGGMENLIPHANYQNGLIQFIALKEGVVTSAIQTLVKDGGIQAEHTDNENVLSFTDTNMSLRLIAEDANGGEPMYSNVDGDEGPALPLEVKVHHQALNVLKPKQ